LVEYVVLQWTTRAYVVTNNDVTQEETIQIARCCNADWGRTEIDDVD
jgi:hypothetical protein